MSAKPDRIEVEEREPDPDSRTNPSGNERLTAAVGLLVVVPVFAEVATILLGVHAFMSAHVPAAVVRAGS